jgi:hypothetical protein
MTRYAGWLVVLLFCSAPLEAREKKPAPKPLLDTWQVAYFEGLKVGHVHTVAVAAQKDGKEVIRTTKTLDFAVKRYGSVMAIKAETTSEETRAGKVLSLGLVHELGKDRKVSLSGTVREGKLVFRTSPDDPGRKLPWDARAVGQYYQETVFQRRKVKSGDKVELLAYELMLPGPLTLRAAVKNEEAVDRLVQKKKGDSFEIVREPARLLRVEVMPEKIKVGDNEVQLPGKRVWLDGKLMPVREQFDMPGLGAITLYPTSKEAALKEGVAPELLPDLGLNIAIKLDQTIDNPYDTTRAVYRVSLTEALDRVFVEDDRQEVRNKKGKTFELVVRAIHEPGKEKGGKAPGRAYRDSNHFIDSDNPRVKALARKAVGAETDPWKKAKRIEKWVQDNMKVSTAVGFPTAAQIARDLEGDCRQHALLTAAMCRAAGLPSRTAIGVVYGRLEGRSPQFIFHMWTEVWVKGQWLGLDAVLGKVGATHLKMGEHHWDRTATLAPLLPISSALGKVRIDVVSAK